MRSILRMLVLTPALCTTAAFAVDRVSVDMPFTFESHGRVFPASRYDVSLTDDRRMLILTSRTNPADRATWMTLSADRGPLDPELSMQFDQNGNTTGTSRRPFREIWDPDIGCALGRGKEPDTRPIRPMTEYTSSPIHN